MTKRQREAGYVTAELAACLPVVVMLLIVGLLATSAVTTQLRCIDTARQAVLAEARGEDGTAAATRGMPPDGEVTIDGDQQHVTAAVTAPVEMPGSFLPSITVKGTAAAAREPGAQP